MQTLDIILVSYNSEKWINQCLDSIVNVNYPLKNIFITIIDNNSSDQSVEIFNNYKNKELLGGYHVEPVKKNLGFGPANNLGVKLTEQPYVFFLNIDTELDPEAINELMNAANEGKGEVGLWECRQFPYEHPKLYNPVTMETNWSSGAACMVRRDYFIEIGMFDEKIFMYAEDVDLSWRLRAHGYKTVYVPKSIVHHYTYESAGEIKPNQFYNSTFNNLMLRYKFGSRKDILQGYLLFYSLLAVKGPSPDHKKVISKNIGKSLLLGPKFRKWYQQHKELDFQPTFRGWDYDLIRNGAFYVNKKPIKQPFVSIIVRTCGRPTVLRETLQSLKNQTYKNFEVVIVEDGPDISRKLIESEFSDLNYQYHYTGKNVGRCEAGNIALSMAKGEYFNFLDDDDLFYADHIEVLVAALEQNPGNKAAYSIAFETPIEITSKDPYQYKELFHNVQYREKFNRLTLLHHNYFPIQTVLFSREFYDKLGGFDNNLEVLEDWDLWIRYAMYGSFLYVDKLTSIYRVPASTTQNFDRQKKLDEYLEVVRVKHSKMVLEVAVADIQHDVEELLNSSTPSIIYKIKNTPLKTLLLKIKNKIYYKIKNILTSR